jgi:hypothetical protein
LNAPPVALNLASHSPPSGTGTSKPAKAVKQRGKAAPKRTAAPKGKTSARPPSVTGFSWRKDGAGWQLRKSVYEPDGTGTQKRRRPYVAHLSKSAFADMKKRHKGKGLSDAISQWIAEHEK